MAHRLRRPADARRRPPALRDSLVTVLGEPQQVEDVYVWDVRGLRS